MSGERAVTAAACYVILRHAGKIFFVMRENTGYHDGEYSLPAGRVEADESYKEGAVREVKEEAGVTVALDALRHVCTMYRSSEDGTRWTDVYFEADKWQDEPYNASPKEHSEGVWLDAEALPDTIMLYQKAALILVADQVSYGEWTELRFHLEMQHNHDLTGGGVSHHCS